MIPSWFGAVPFAHGSSASRSSASARIVSSSAASNRPAWLSTWATVTRARTSARASPRAAAASHAARAVLRY